MSERFERLRQARERKGYSGPKDAAVAFGWNSNTYSSNENGNAPFSFKAAERYALAFGVRAEWLYSGAEPMLAERKEADAEVLKVPVISWVSAGQLEQIGEIVDLEGGDWTVVAGLPRSKYFATRVQGDSMDRFSPEGSVIIVDTQDVDPRPGRAYVFSLRGEATYKVYRDDPVVRLEPYSTNPNHQAIFPGRDRDWGVVGRVVRTLYDLP